MATFDFSPTLHSGATRSGAAADAHLVAIGLVRSFDGDAGALIERKLKAAADEADQRTALYWQAVLAEFRAIQYADNDAQFLSA
jgi:hypothetical protein